MNILRVERAMEPCLEGGFVGYYFYFSEPVSETFVKALASFGSLTFMKQMIKPFFMLRGERFILRGQVGDDFCRAGIEAGNGECLEALRRAVELLPT